MSTHRPNLRRVLSDTWRLITAQPRHFSTLSILFLLPNYSLSAITYTFLSLHPTSHLLSGRITIPILYAVFVLVFGICAKASITHSTFRGFYGKPGVLISSLDSIRVSFLPLLATHLTAKITQGLIVLGFGNSVRLTYEGLRLLSGQPLEIHRVYFLVLVFVTVLNLLIAAFLAAAMIYFIFRWYVATPVVVAESQWGFPPLKRSGFLVHEAKRVVFSMMFFFGILFGVSWIWCWNLVAIVRRNSTVRWEYFVVQMIFCVGFWTILSLYSMAATTVLFIHCKAALHGGVEMVTAFQIDLEDDGGDDVDEEEELGRKIYVRLPFH
ncbi:hypothetical protein ABFS82_12G096900 [Erythranthe guttata]|uniref:Uncharacterized protein n=1 Tax=Erythranthe guttata TaxID=4155 RepID=A0A022QQN0_ERYGU|nr:PREDICTED: uncharacterized protein LOC105967427 [Erythranthe guttata]EYU28810.1 hypothetical protein MIMGU_mgv1a021600mg [Erythranthe guttata]|eukprot:XP_012847475.1 PREDICTED: uncharacterized protein LOC105967427 [Erythranthe guttata]